MRIHSWYDYRRTAESELFVLINTALEFMFTMDVNKT